MQHCSCLDYQTAQSKIWMYGILSSHANFAWLTYLADSLLLPMKQKE